MRSRGKKKSTKLLLMKPTLVQQPNTTIKSRRAIQPIDHRYRWNHSRLMHQDCYDARLIECFFKKSSITAGFSQATPPPQLPVHAALSMAAMMCQ